MMDSKAMQQENIYVRMVVKLQIIKYVCTTDIQELISKSSTISTHIV